MEKDNGENLYNQTDPILRKKKNEPDDDDLPEMNLEEAGDWFRRAQGLNGYGHCPNCWGKGTSNKAN